jgi:hypothetical protein
LKRAIGSTSIDKEVYLPHGAVYGYDVPNENLLEFVHKDSENEILLKCFSTALGQNKSARFGEKIGKALHSDATNDKKLDWKKLPQNRLKMKEYFDLYYYRPERRASKRFIYFAFQSALPVVLDRLLEANDSYEGITIIALPFPDETLTPPESQDSRKKNLTKEQLICHRHIEIYKKYASIFRPAKT